MPLNSRIAVACIMQESNSFSERQSNYVDFVVETGDAVSTRYRDTNTEIGGFLQGAGEQGFDALPILSAWAIAGGPLEVSSFDRLTGELCRSTIAAQPDGMLLALHGALLLATNQSGDLEIVRRVRAALPPGVPLVITMDFHANITAELMELADGIVGYRTYPHIDMADTGRRACRLLRRLLSGKPAVNHWISIPLIFPPEASSTSQQPMQTIMNDLLSRYSEDRGQYASLFCVQPWLDIPSMGSSLVVTDFTADPGVARGLEQAAAFWWSRRRDCEVNWTGPEDLMDSIGRSPGRPVLVSEAFDAPNGGSTGDHTGLLGCLLAAPGRYRSCLYLVDPETPSRVSAGNTVRVTVGSRLNPTYSNPLTFDADVVSVSDGRFVLKGPVFTGKQLSMGPTCVLRMGTTHLVVGSRPVLTSDPELFRSQGIEPMEQDAVGIKSPTLFRAAYDSISRTVLYLDMPGPCRGNLLKVPFQNIGRPIFPLDDFEWAPSPR